MTTTLQTGAPHAAPYDPILSRHGFEPSGHGYRRGKLRFHRTGDWWLLSLRDKKEIDSLGTERRPGLWKHCGANRTLVFPLPAMILHDDGGIDPDSDAVPVDDDLPALESCLRWAVTTLGGDVPEGWEAPGEDALASWTGDHGLTIQHDAVLRQVEVNRRGGRFALQVPLAGPVPADLPQARRAWFRTLLCDAQEDWRLVRITLTADGHAMAEVDLTGVPAAVSRYFVQAGLASLRWMAAGVVESAEFLIDPGAPSHALQLCPPPGRIVTKTKKQQEQDHG